MPPVSFSALEAKGGEVSARARAAGVFDYMHEGQALFSLTVERPAQADRRRRIVEEGQRLGVYAILLAWLLLVWAARASGSWVPWVPRWRPSTIAASSQLRRVGRRRTIDLLRCLQPGTYESA